MAQNICREINKAFDSAMNEERSFNGTRTSPTEKLRQGLAYKDMKNPQEPSGRAPGRKSSVDLIAEGLEA